MSVRAVGRRAPLAFLLAVAVAAGVSCNGDGTPPEDPAISISVSPTSASVQQGASTDVAVTVTGSGGFTGAANIALQSPPAGITGTVSGLQTTDGTTTATITVAVGAAVAPGTYTLDVRASGSGVSAVSAAFALTVTAAPAYTLAATPTQLTVEQDGTGTVNVSLTRTNFTGGVTLAVEGAPSGVTPSFDTNPVTDDAAVLTLDVDAGTATGSYTLTLRGTATGLADRTATIQLTVSAPGSSFYVLSVDPSSLSVAQSATGTVNVGISRVSFADPVTLGLEGAPSGVTGDFSVNPVSGDASVLTLTVGASVTPAEYVLTVRGTTAGLPDETMTVTLTVEPAPGFSIGSIAPLSVQQGQSATRTVTLVRTGGFTGDVTVTVTDLPAGITATVDPVTTSGTSVDVTVGVAGTVAVGGYTATVRGNATGQPEATQDLEISVLTAAGQQVSLDFSICTSDERPTWLAYQDGSGPWTTVNAVGDTYTFNVASSTAAVAVTTEPAVNQSAVFVLYATQAELVGGDLSELCDVVSSGKTVNATVAGINPMLGEGAALTLGDAVVEAQQDGPVSWTTVPDGNVNLVGYKWSQLGTTDRMLIQRGLAPAAGSDLGTLDFAGSGAFNPVAATVTVQGGSGDSGSWETEYATSPSPGVCHYASLDAFFYTGNQFAAGGAPVGQQQANEFHVITLTDGFNYVSQAFAQWQDRTLSYGAAIPAPTITDVTGALAYRRLRAEATLPAEYNSLQTLALSDDSGDRGIAVLATADFLGGQSVTLEVPDLTGAAGWDDLWAPSSASATNWIFQASGWTGTECVEGAREVSRIQMGMVN